MVESFLRDVRVVIGADFNGHVAEETGEEEVMMSKKKNMEGQMEVDFAKKKEKKWKWL